MAMEMIPMIIAALSVEAAMVLMLFKQVGRTTSGGNHGIGDDHHTKPSMQNLSRSELLHRNGYIHTY